MPESKCEKCGVTITYELVSCLGTTFNFRPRICDACCAADEARQKKEEERERIENALSVLPYRFNPKIGNMEAVNAIGSVAFAAGKPSGKSIWIGGKTGAGKTTGVCAVLEIWVRRGHTFRWMKCKEELNNYSALLGENGIRAAALLKGYACNRSLLVIDDLGVGPITGRGEEFLFEIMDNRYARGLATWVTSNLTPSGIGSWFGFDRLMAERLIRRVKDVFVELEIKGVRK